MKRTRCILYALIIAICFASCAYTATENEQLAALGIDFPTGWKIKMTTPAGH